MGIDESYLMPAYVKLLVNDAARAAAFYEALGFTRIHQDPVFVHLRWARYADVFLVAMPQAVSLPGARGVGVLLCFHAGDVSLETIATRAAAQGATTDGPRDQPWHTRELLVTDPEGYRLTFVEPTPQFIA
ncbi:VOC family protein [Polyangium aurulentum]|uniref:VOC family protein n=1 Tax=Polyangium aurulentum TaxID=2567896 RepID=UPI0010AE7E63|nr:VOC family protein [Polyangium aurulentum]UQA55574.1 VOC family protein [Polyangium aurulentum]